MTNGKWFVLVIAFFLITWSCGTSSPGPAVYPKAVGAADEGFAIQALRTIATAQAQSKVTRGSYGDFVALTQTGLLDQRFATDQPNLKGYRFTMTVSDSGFFVNADPHTTEAQPTTGSRHFYLDSSDNAIHVNANQMAAKTDPIL